jgi:hypothetical protein
VRLAERTAGGAGIAFHPVPPGSARQTPDQITEFSSTQVFLGVRAVKKNAKFLSAVFGLMVLLALPRSVTAQTPPAQPLSGQASAATVTNAQTFLRDQAKGSLLLIQFGCTLKGVNADYVKHYPDGTFTVGVRYGWSGLDNGNDHTDIYYTFDANGRLKSSKVGSTSAIIFTPFSVVNRAADVLRDEIRKVLRDAPVTIRKLAEQFVLQQNAQSLHELILRYQQSPPPPGTVAPPLP